ncbi:MAG: hypothetical protein IPK86_04320 [Neisseriales bacterium]|nr:MAG: hypothetical protein IPK86_04320 [Neisseriales bacterium]
MKSKVLVGLVGLFLSLIATSASAKDDPLEKVRYVGDGIAVIGDTVLIGVPKDHSQETLEDLYIATEKNLKAIGLNNARLLNKLRHLKINEKELRAMKKRCKELSEDDFYRSEKVRSLCQMLEEF